MSVFTTELRYICEHYAGLNESKPYFSVNGIISASRTKIFNFDYPIFDVNYKPILETKIIRHFYTQEIGFETVGLWLLKLETKMNEIMPYYNQLYKSELLEFNPLYDTDLTRHDNRENYGTKDDNTDYTGTQTEKSERDMTGDTVNNTTHNINSDRNINRTDRTTDNLNRYNDRKYWDTPQSNVAGFEDNRYMTNRTYDKGEENRNIDETENTQDNYSENKYEDFTSKYIGNDDFSGTIDNVNNTKFDSITHNLDEYWNTLVGKSPGKSYSELLNEFRSTFLNIDMMIIDELKSLFMGLWEGVM